MRRIIRRRELLEDELRYAGEPQGPGTVTVQSAAQWLAARLRPNPRGDAVLIGPPIEVESLAAHLPGLRLDRRRIRQSRRGPWFSQARLLRQRYRYAAELRARGALKRDQLFFLARCGFDSLRSGSGRGPGSRRWRALDSFTVAYQDGDESLVKVRRRAAGAAV